MTTKRPRVGDVVTCRGRIVSIWPINAPYEYTILFDGDVGPTEEVAASCIVSVEPAPLKVGERVLDFSTAGGPRGTVKGEILAIWNEMAWLRSAMGFWTSNLKHLTRAEPSP